MKFLKGIKPALEFPDLKGRKGGLKFKIEITEDMHYDVGDPTEQMDWIKILGKSSNRFNNHKDACMVVGRYSPSLKLWQFVFYYHFRMQSRSGWSVVGSKNGHFKNHEIVTARLGDVVTGYIDPLTDHWATAISVNGGQLVKSEVPSAKELKRTFEIKGWHGGTLPSNRTYCFNKIINND